ncbi:unnamed protein product [Amoebophrya sp. A25]|nr:unnamed protein product [Amoebophrya sp. A25]|eukprot:GSA25T00009588001.1
MSERIHNYRTSNKMVLKWRPSDFSCALPFSSPLSIWGFLQSLFLLLVML